MKIRSSVRVGLFASVAFHLFTAPAAAFSVTPGVAFTQSNSAAHSMTSGSFSAGANSAIIAQGNVNGLNNASDTLSVTDNTGGAIAWGSPIQCATPGATTKITFAVVGYTSAGFTSKTVTIADTAVAGTFWSSGGGLGISTVTGTPSSSIEDAAARACDGSTTATTAPNLNSGTPTAAGELLFAIYDGQRSSSGASFTEDTANGWANLFGPFGGASQALSGSYVVDSGSSPVAHNPVVTSAPYAHQIIGICPSGGCTARPVGQICTIGAIGAGVC